MEKVLDATTADVLEKDLHKLKQLADKCRVVEERLAKAESQKGSVKAEIFEKVCAEYRDSLRALKEELGPIEKKIKEARAKIDQEMRSTESELAKAQDQFEEFAFRHRVGEFDEKRFTEATKPLVKQTEDMERRRDELVVLRRRIDEASSKESAPKARPTIRPAGESKRTSGPTLVNPSDWMSELLEDDSQSGATISPSRARRAGAEQNQGQLSDLADPSDDARAADTVAASAFPVLIITKGPGAGKKLPLVPMTMTLGREHDNNIELKDEDVARYHARIAYKRGKYVLEDLDSSSGTWVNDEQVTKAELKHSDKIRLGGTELIVDFH